MNAKLQGIYGKSLFTLSAYFTAPLVILAQALPTGINDPLVTPGNPFATYRLSGIDKIDYFSWGVTLEIPIASIGGRGAGGYNITVPLRNTWIPFLSHRDDVPSTIDYDLPSGHQRYGAGTLSFERKSNPPDRTCPNDPGVSFPGESVLYLVWTAPDGSETLLFDTKTNGQPLFGTVDCNARTYQGPDRGTVFRSVDGTDLTFVSSVEVAGDASLPGTQGLLYTRDGTRYSFDSWGGVRQIEDRNGNLTQFANRLDGFDATDSEGRHVTAAYSSWDSATYPYPTSAQDVITYRANGTNQTVTIHYSPMNTVMAGESTQSYYCLFPDLLDPTNEVQFNPLVASSISLPDGTSYSLRYNAYGEVAQVTLPTGGMYRYKFAEANCQNNGNSGLIAYGSGPFAVVRRLLERDEYSDGINLSGKLLLSAGPASADPSFPSRPVSATTVQFQDSNGNTLRQEVHYFYGDSVSLAVDRNQPFAYWWKGKEFKMTVGTPGATTQTTENTLCQRPFNTGDSAWYNPNSETAPAHDMEICQTDTTLENGSKSRVSLSFDQYNNVIDQKWFDWGAGAPGALLKEAQTSFNYAAVFVNLNILNLPAETQIFDSAGSKVADTKYGYDETGVGNAPNIVGHDNGNYGGGGIRGNLTSVQRCLNPASCSWLTTRYTYDIAGNVLSITDPNYASDPRFGPTNFSYADNQNTYAHVTSRTNALGQKETWQYDYDTGKPVLETDANLVQTKYEYIDPLSRVTDIHRGVNGSTSLAYEHIDYPSPADVHIHSDQTTENNPVLHSETLYDGLGRQVESRQYEDSGQYISTKKRYDALSRVVNITNPCRPGSCDATTYGYDALGRVVSKQIAQDQPITTVYSGNQTTVTDQAGKVRATLTDALGRITTVVEDPGNKNYTTTYSYNALDDLIHVNQSGRTRDFAYDSVKRLIAARNPENASAQNPPSLPCGGATNGFNGVWTTCYGYDSNGNLTSKMDNRNVQIGYTYDPLNRMTAKNYPPGTPPVTYTYDTASNGIGRLASIGSGGSSTTYGAYDGLGRITQSTQVTLNQTFPFSYNYNRAGALVSETYPSGRKVTTGYDSANRAWLLQGMQGTTTTNYIGKPSDPTTWISYWPHGGIYSFGRGNSLWHFASFNNHLQQTESYESLNNINTLATMLFVSCPNWGVNTNLNVLNICPQATQANDNGNLQSYDEYMGGPGYTQPGHYGQTFAYDGVNRLISAGEGSNWSRTFDYDPWGNLAEAGNGILLNVNTATSLSQYNANNQRSDLGQGYDAAGNQTSMNPQITLTYDAENRQTAAGGYTYAYDGDGRRVMKVGGGVTTVFVYDAMGELAAEYSNAANTSSCLTCYLSYDHLGTTRLVTNASGQVVSRHDYLPFGEEIPGGVGGRDSTWGSSADFVNQKFTGKERDPETQSDYFGARYYGGALGRWISPDKVNMTDQRLQSPTVTLNKYGYGGSNPLEYVDVDGEDITVFYEAGVPGHTILLAYNQETGQSGLRSFGPDHSQIGMVHTASGLPVSATDRFGLENIKSADDLRQHFSSITIQTSPEEAQKVINTLIEHPDGKYTTYWNNCTTTCAQILRDIGKLDEHPLTPVAQFNALYYRYGNQAASEGFWGTTFKNGIDYGKHKLIYNPFDLLFKTINCTKYTWTTTNSEGKVIQKSSETVCR
jgi:RHS repeat-associated protein